MEKITVEVTISAELEHVWEFWTNPEHIKKWNNATTDWHTTYAENDLKVGGTFLSRMEAVDGSFAFDFTGKYDNVMLKELIEYTLDDNRKVQINFAGNDNETTILETFEAESENPKEMQKEGWQLILNNFKNYVESK
jgi:uncharacterized protein YndB with AHSA1/START domain